ncbi:MAG: AAA family ATPase [Pseudomonadota bacterium]
MITTLAFANYRSLRQLVLPLAPLTVVTGANGTGKSNVYRGLRLLASAASGGHRNGLIAGLANEGGLQSVLFAGPEQGGAALHKRGLPVQGTVRRDPVRVKLGFATAATEHTLGYALELGVPVPGALGPTAFALDPEIKYESVFHGPLLRPAGTLVERTGPMARARQGRRWQVVAPSLSGHDSVLDSATDGGLAELDGVRRTLRSWRFYDHLRTDRDAPARAAHIGTRTPVLSDSGSDLAAALQTVIEIGDAEALHDAVDDAFPGASVSVTVDRGLFNLVLQRRGLLRPLAAAELSDGTLRYLMLLAALLSPRPPSLLVLNEPETSLHPDLMAPLARLISQCPVQVLVVTHAAALVRALEARADGTVLQLVTEQGETCVHGLHDLDAPPWRWPGG